MTDDAEIRSSWDANAAAWTHMVRHERTESRRLVTDAAVVAAVLRTVADARVDASAEAPLRVLDIGCGEGWLARELSSKGCDVTGIDGSAALVQAASEAGGAHYLHLTFADLVADPHAAGDDFDVAVFSFSLLDRDIRDILAAACTAVKPRGRLVIQTIHPFNDIQGAYKDEWRTEQFDAFNGAWKAMPWYFRTMSTWINDVAAAGWRITGMTEPLHPITNAIASLIIEASKAIF